MRRFQYAVAVIMTAVMCLMPVLQPYAAYAEVLAAERQLYGTSGSSAAEDGAGTSSATEDGSADEGSAGEEASSSTGGSGDGSAAVEPTQPSDAGSETAGSADSAADASTEDAQVTADESADAAAEDGERDISADEFRGNSWRFENGQLIGGLDDESARSGNFRARAMNALPEGATAQGIDVSEFQYQINWDAVKASGVDFAIIRIGWWNNGVDKYFERNVAECERLGIPWGAYLYSYSMDAEDAASEANHAIDLMNQMKAKGYTPDLPVYLDLEDAEVPRDAAKLATISSTFNSKIAAAGYEPGVYASASWWKNYLTSPVFDSWSKWSAQYYSVCEAPSDPDMWQYTSSGSVPGISGPVDVNYWYDYYDGDHWIEVGEDRYYVNKDGEPYTGELKVGGSWYWLDPERGGAMATGFVDLPTGKTVYYGADGAMRHGEQKIGGLWYHFDEDSGAMSVGFTDLGSKTVYYGEDGAMLHGRHEIGGEVYFFDVVSGGLVRSGWVEDGGYEYFADSTGAFRAMSFVGDGGDRFLLDSLGNPQKPGWYEFGESRFYVISVDGKMADGEYQIGGKWYFFNSDCAMQTGFVRLNDSTSPSGTKWVYYCSDGYMLYGEQKINGGWYYLNPISGAVTYGWLYLASSDKWVYYGESTGDGRMRYGTQIVDGVRRYFDPITGAADKIGYQNPIQYYQVSTRDVSLPSYAGGGIFSYITPSRIAVDASRNDCINVMITRAFDYLGTAYRWDYSCAPGVGVDCSGLVMQALYATGMSMSPYNPWDHYYTPGHDHYANDMWNDSKFMHLNFSQRQRGDLVCYSGHIAIYLGNDQIIEASNPAGVVRISSVYSSSGIKGVLRPFV
ncbi:GH25 family lysozyme [Candidatus Collinsella stercoripullorum]|uniref:GH25 family lysozyme n=1 Tax=Candidatus Collinsella stercoripullorum TaxID=2838522 RepID=UPI0022E6E41A|nr:GH25 family lysozyme [Candidatus Collinsella stercoripullorum]